MSTPINKQVNERVYLSSPHMGGSELGFINVAFEENWIAPLGPNVNGFEEDISSWDCDTTNDCVPRYLQNIYVPEFLFAEIEAQVLQQMLMTIKVPSEDSDNKQNVNR